MNERDAVTLRRRFHQHLADSALVPRTAQLLVAVSGGLDSVVLLHLLRFAPQPYPITVAHYDHAMRTDSARDTEWLRGLCRAWNLPFVTARATTPPRSEAAARAQRYAFLEDAARAAGADAILTAHHADDQAETVLFRILRGTGIGGLAGIHERRGRIVRPLLPFLRRELSAYARGARLQWRQDPTNLDVRYARNRIRRDVLPQLERSAPGITRRLAQLAADAAQEERAWRDVITEVVRDVTATTQADRVALARDRLLAYHPHIRARVMRQLIHELGSRADRAATRSVLRFIAHAASGSQLTLPRGLRLHRDLDRLVLRRAATAPPAADVPLEIATTEAGTGDFVIGGRRWVARWTPVAPVRAREPRPDVDAPRQGLVGWFDPSSLRFPLTLRAWRAGDRIRLAYGSKKLKKLFLERRLARARRARTPVLTDRDGQVLWVAGVQQAQGTAAAGGDLFEITVVHGDTD